MVRKINDKALTNAERCRRYRQKLIEESHDEYKQNECERWKGRKANGKLKTVDNLSRRDQKAQREKWKKSSQEFRQRKEAIKSLISPPSTPETVTGDEESEAGHPIPNPRNEMKPGPSGESGNKKVDGRTVSGCKRRIQAKVATKRTLDKARDKISTQRQEINRCRVQISRLKRKIEYKPDTPRSKVRKLLQGVDVEPIVRRHLVYQEAVLRDVSRSKTNESDPDDVTVTETSRDSDNNEWETTSKDDESTKNEESEIDESVLNLNVEAELKQPKLRVSPRTVKKYRMRTWLKSTYNVDARRLKTNKRRGNKPLDRKKKECIHKFYERDDVSRMTSGKGEIITRNKVQKQRRYLLDNIYNLYQRYLNTNQRFLVSRAVFYKNKPFWVLKPKVGNRETVQCERCTNVQFMADVLHKNSVIKVQDIKKHADDMYCDFERGHINEKCYERECSECSGLVVSLNEDVDLTKQVVYYRWVTELVDLAEVRGTGPNTQTRITLKKPMKASLESIAEDFQNDLCERAARHIITYQHQTNVLYDLKSKLGENEMIIHMDWSENYSCKYSTETQKMHFGASRQQVSIHDGVVYVGNQRPRSFATISNSPRHDAVAVWTHIRPVINWMIQDFPNLDTIHIVSDGPSTQYRNKINFYLFSTVLPEEYPSIKHAQWNFSGASHGKSAADGIGAAIKRRADNLVANGTDIANAETMYEKLSNGDQSKIKLFFILPSEIEKNDDDIPLRLKPINGTMKIHQIKLTEKFILQTRNLGCYCQHPSDCDCYTYTQHSFKKTMDDLISETESITEAENTASTILLSDELVGKWCIVTYDTKPYVGRIDSYDSRENEVEVTVMTLRSQNLFNWPTTEDRLSYPEGTVMVIIDGVMNKQRSQRHFSLNDSDWATYQNLV